MELSSVCVFCGSKVGARPAYADLARRLGEALARRGLGLVYGGGKIGLMGVLADAVLAHGGRVTGVIPDVLMVEEVAHHGLSELVVTRSMHERKLTMAERADAFIALPGGLGTLEELFETWTWAQLGIHQKPCALLDVDGYYDGLVRFVDHAVSEAFVRPSHRALLVVERDPEALLDHFARYEPPGVEPLLEPSQA